MTKRMFLLRGVVLLVLLAVLQRLQMGVSFTTIVHHPDVLWRSGEYALSQK